MKTDQAVYRPMIGVALATAVILAIPLLAMQVTDEVAWTAGDFLVAAVLLLGTGFTYVLATRGSRSAVFRWAVGVGLAAALGLIWVNGAVGLIGDEGNPANLMYGGVLAVAAAGALLARLRARGMALAMFAAAGAQVLVTVIALVNGLGAPATGVVELLGGNGLFIALWVWSGGLFLVAEGTDEDGVTG